MKANRKMPYSFLRMTLFIAVFLTSTTIVSAQNIRSKQLLRDIEILSSDVFEGRKTGTKANQMAADYITNRFKEIGLSSYQKDYKQLFSFKNSRGTIIKGANLIGYIKGTTDDAIVISAHYDHIGIIKYQINNGADDNASGVSALLAFAEYFVKNKPKHTLIFAAFDAEEAGLKGAKAFIKNPPLKLSQVKINVNMDMISHNDKGELYACGTYHYPALKKYMRSSIESLKLVKGHDNPKLGHDDWTDQSDHYAFHVKKIPFIYFGVEDHKDYHKPTDEYQNINRAFFVNASNVILDIIKNFDQNFQVTLKDRMIMKQPKTK